MLPAGCVVLRLYKYVSSTVSFNWMQIKTVQFGGVEHFSVCNIGLTLKMQDLQNSLKLTLLGFFIHYSSSEGNCWCRQIVSLCLLGTLLKLINEVQEYWWCVLVYTGNKYKIIFDNDNDINFLYQLSFDGPAGWYYTKCSINLEV